MAGPCEVFLKPQGPERPHACSWPRSLWLGCPSLMVLLWGRDGAAPCRPLGEPASLQSWLEVAGCKASLVTLVNGFVMQRWLLVCALWWWQ